MKDRWFDTKVRPNFYGQYGVATCDDGSVSNEDRQALVQRLYPGVPGRLAPHSWAEYKNWGEMIALTPSSFKYSHGERSAEFRCELMGDIPVMLVPVALKDARTIQNNQCLYKYEAIRIDNVENWEAIADQVDRMLDRLQESMQSSPWVVRQKTSLDWDYSGVGIKRYLVAVNWIDYNSNTHIFISDSYGPCIWYWLNDFSGSRCGAFIVPCWRDMERLIGCLAIDWAYWFLKMGRNKR